MHCRRFFACPRSEPRGPRRPAGPRLGRSWDQARLRDTHPIGEPIVGPWHEVVCPSGRRLEYRLTRGFDQRAMRAGWPGRLGDERACLHRSAGVDGGGGPGGDIRRGPQRGGAVGHHWPTVIGMPALDSVVASVAASASRWAQARTARAEAATPRAQASRRHIFVFAGICGRKHELPDAFRVKHGPPHLQRALSGLLGRAPAAGTSLCSGCFRDSIRECARPLQPTFQGPRREQRLPGPGVCGGRSWRAPVRPATPDAGLFQREASGRDTSRRHSHPISCCFRKCHPGAPRGGLASLCG